MTGPTGPTGASAAGIRSQVDGTSSGPTSASASFLVIPQMTVSVTTAGGDLLVLFDGSFNLATADSWSLAVFLDGTQQTTTLRHLAFTGSGDSVGGIGGTTVALLTGVAAGAHTVDVRWSVAAGQARAVLTERKLVVVELR